MLPALKGAENGEAVLAQYRARLEGARVEAVRRHGKYFWVWVARGAVRTAVLMHLGMTGRVRLRGVQSHLVFMEDVAEREKVALKRDAKLESVNEEADRVNLKSLEGHTIVNRVKEEPALEREVSHEGAGAEGEGYRATDKKLRAKRGRIAAKDQITANEDTANEKITAQQNEAHDEPWPPRYSKFELELEKDGSTIQLSFADPRRLGRVRVLWGEGFSSDTELMAQEPLARLGPDYSKPAVLPFFARAGAPYTAGDPDPDPHGRPRLAYDEFARTVLARKRPIKALLLDQAHFAGVGNWVGDEILHQARLHPADVLATHIQDPADPRLVELYHSVIYVMEHSVAVEGSIERFPRHWLMPHRWGKRDKARARTDLGAVEFETVGGRTSCFVPAVQKRMGPRSTPPVKRTMAATEEDHAPVKSLRRAP